VTVITKQRSQTIEEVKNLCTKYCCKSLNKQSSGVQERINPFYINCYGENSFGLRTFRFTNDLQERIKFVNRGLTVLASIKYSLSHSPCMALKCPRLARTDTDWGIWNSPWQSFVMGTADHTLFVTSKQRIPDKRITDWSAVVLRACESNRILWETDSY